MTTRFRCAPPQILTGLGVLAVIGVIAMTFRGSAVPGPPETVLRGIALAMHPEASARFNLEYPPSVTELADLGAQAILVPIAVVQDNLQSSSVAPGPMTPSFADIRNVVRQAHTRGLSTVLMPFVVLDAGPPSAWRGRIAPSDPKAWWASYQALILRYAGLAASEHVAVLVIGSELTSMYQRPEPWAHLAEAVRAVYPGQLALVANHDALEQIAPFAYVDIAGVSAYAALSDDLDASQQELQDRWQAVLPELRRFAVRTQRPLVVFEVGYPSIDGGAVQPWNYLSGGPVDLQEQAEAYAAAVEALEQPWIAGVFFWTWFGPGGSHDRTYTPRGKPALVHLRRFFTAREF